jgi:hypothetical protein
MLPINVDLSQPLFQLLLLLELAKMEHLLPSLNLMPLLKEHAQEPTLTEEHGLCLIDVLELPLPLKSPLLWTPLPQ